MALNSPHCYEQSQRYTQGTSNFDLGLTRMIKITIPLPPLAEQRRIVAKVDALMALCDRLEAALTPPPPPRRRLLDALLAEALAPVDAREMEVAE
jgi:type I restriction enzyme S subunit